MSVIDEYLKNVSTSQRDELERVRQIVKQTVPGAEEVMSYGMPAFKYNGQYLIAFAAFKNHSSIFPTSGPVEAMKEKLSGFKFSKGTIQFTTENQIPESTIKEIVAHRFASISKH
jgi:uncharacterized protein YdhG (YjbR/CyaY superfamily)